MLTRQLKLLETPEPQLSSILLDASSHRRLLAHVLYDHLPSPSLTKNSSPYHFAHDADDSWYVKQRLRAVWCCGLASLATSRVARAMDLKLGTARWPCGFVRDARALLVAGQRGPSLWLRPRSRDDLFIYETSDAQVPTSLSTRSPASGAASTPPTRPADPRTRRRSKRRKNCSSRTCRRSRRSRTLK